MFQSCGKADPKNMWKSGTHRYSHVTLILISTVAPSLFLKKLVF